MWIPSGRARHHDGSAEGEVARLFLHRRLPTFVTVAEKGSPFRLFELIRRWPKLRALNVDGFKELKDSSRFHFSSSTSRCSELQTIGIATPKGHDLRNINFTSLSVMCGHVTLLSVEGCIYSQATWRALCGCLRTWSQTLVCVKLFLSIQHSESELHLLFQTLPALAGLQELQLQTTSMDFGSIADLALLQRFCFASQEGISAEQILDLCGLLEDPKKFCALCHISTEPDRPIAGMLDPLENVCCKWGIDLDGNLRLLENQKSIPGFLL